MAVTIGDLQVETQEPPTPSGSHTASAPQQPEHDLKAELETLRERDLRLRAD
jgi:hypothetical protein